MIDGTPMDNHHVPEFNTEKDHSFPISLMRCAAQPDRACVLQTIEDASIYFTRVFAIVNRPSMIRLVLYEENSYNVALASFIDNTERSYCFLTSECQRSTCGGTVVVPSAKSRPGL